MWYKTIQAINIRDKKTTSNDIMQNVFQYVLIKIQITKYISKWKGQSWNLKAVKCQDRSCINVESCNHEI